MQRSEDRLLRLDIWDIYLGPWNNVHRWITKSAVEISNQVNQYFHLYFFVLEYFLEIILIKFCIIALNDLSLDLFCQTPFRGHDTI